MNMKNKWIIDHALVCKPDMTVSQFAAWLRWRR